MRRRGCGCAAVGCAIPLVCLLVIFGAVGILTGNWAALAAPKVPAAPPAVADPGSDFAKAIRVVAKSLLLTEQPKKKRLFASLARA